jgi:hypothetical protein
VWQHARCDIKEDAHVAVLFYMTTALHVSGIIVTHLQEHKTTVTTAFGKRYTVIDNIKFLLLKRTDRLD